MKLFLTYSRENQDVVEELQQDLVDVDHDVWMDRELTGGQGWWDVILTSIRDCDALIIVCTNDSLQSVACLAELRYADALNKAIIPVRCDLDIDMELSPSPLPLLQWIPFARQDRYSELKSLLKAIRRSESGAPPDELPSPPPVPMSYLVSFKQEIDSDQPLDRAAQLDLLHRMEVKTDDVANRSRLLQLVGKLRDREDLFASVLPNVDSLLARLTPTEPTPEPEPAAAMPAPPATAPPAAEPIVEDAPLPADGGTAATVGNHAAETSDPLPSPVAPLAGVTVEKPPDDLGHKDDFIHWWNSIDSPAARGVAWNLLTSRQQVRIYEHIWVYALGKKIGFKSGAQQGTYVGRPFGALPDDWQGYIQQCDLRG